MTYLLCIYMRIIYKNIALIKLLNMGNQSHCLVKFSFQTTHSVITNKCIEAYVIAVHTLNIKNIKLFNQIKKIMARY